jgi:hypothetical protein
MRSLNVLFRALVFCLFVVSCSPSIGNRAVLSTTFETGRTTKNDVANTLGLPVAMRTDEQSGLELWAYEQSPELRGIQFAVVTPTGPSSFITTMNYVSVVERQGDVFQSAAVVYAFNREGIMVHVDRRNVKGSNE